METDPKTPKNLGTDDARMERVAPPLVIPTDTDLADLIFSSKTYASHWATLYHDLNMPPASRALSGSSPEGDGSEVLRNAHTHAHIPNDPYTNLERE